MNAVRALVDVLDDLLPQTQCGKCGYAGCRPYAEALATGSAPINRCPPGGHEGIAQLAAVLRVEIRPLDPECGSEGPERLAVIDEAVCIGCALCIRACPVDAIIGAAKRLHSVLLEHCTGCELCLPPCPVDCIEMIARDQLAAEGAMGARKRQQRSPVTLRSHARSRYTAHQSRCDSTGELEKPRMSTPKSAAGVGSAAMKRQAIASALQRARQRRAIPGSG